jgi:hypothetical protein
VINRFVGKPRRRHGSFGVDRVGVSELRLAELAAGGMVDLGSCCPPVRVVIRAIQLVCGTGAAAKVEGWLRWAKTTSGGGVTMAADSAFCETSAL